MVDYNNRRQENIDTVFFKEHNANHKAWLFWVGISQHNNVWENYFCHFFAACNCPTGQVCDVNDGKCCEPNDPKCDICPPYHIRTAGGCEYCGQCEEKLFKRVDKMLGNYSTDGTGVATEESKERLNKIEIDLKK